jgi:2-keto-4-pentenoate hydratase/2-oxohepta-3-ene-1,7-dioic acid hydratase in catechol pathway
LYSLLTYSEGDIARSGILVDGRVCDLKLALEAFARTSGETLDFPTDTVMDVLGSWDAARPVIAACARAYLTDRPTGGSLFERSPSRVRLLAPMLYPSAIYCAAVNYVDHLKEVLGKEPPDKATTRPFFFLKTPRQSVIGTDEPIRLPSTSSKVDWEAELGVVIGRAAHRVSREEAMSYVAGYTIVNDLSARDLSKRSDWELGTDWFRAKCFDTSAPMGPWITPAESVTDPHDLGMKLWINDELMQDSSSRFMHFTIPELIEYVSEQVTLFPGDVIATGTPAGTGNRRGIYLKPGDMVTITIEGIGTLSNTVVAAS